MPPAAAGKLLVKQRCYFPPSPWLRYFDETARRAWWADILAERDREAEDYGVKTPLTYVTAVRLAYVAPRLVFNGMCVTCGMGADSRCTTCGLQGRSFVHHDLGDTCIGSPVCSLCFGVRACGVCGVIETHPGEEDAEQAGGAEEEEVEPELEEDVASSSSGAEEEEVEPELEEDVATLQ